LQREARDALDDDRLSGVGAVVANCLPSLPVNTHLAPWPAVAHGDAFGTHEPFSADRRLPTLRKPDPETSLAELDRHPHHDRGDPPAGRQDEDRQENGED